MTAGRGFAPSLSLGYDSGNGADAFGMGWQVGLAAVRRRTSGQLPSYSDKEDVFSFGGQDLVPVVDDGGEQSITTVQEDGETFKVRNFRTRVEGSFTRIELWRGPANVTHWRSWTADNIVTVFGRSEDCRVFDPENPARIASWLIEYQADDKGNLIYYQYKQEDDANVDFTQPSEMHRRDITLANRYPKCVYYNNARPHDGAVPSPSEFTCILLFDYGEHSENFPTLTEEQHWPAREHPMSDYRNGFELRQRRLCRRIIRLHNFDDNGPTPIDALELGFEVEELDAEMLVSIQQLAWPADAANDQSAPERMPPATMHYSSRVWHKQGRANSFNIDHGDPLTGVGLSRWTDLYGDGLPGRLGMAGGTLFFRRNQGQGKFGPARAINRQPILSGAASSFNVSAPNADGQIALLHNIEGAEGYFPAGPNAEFTNFIQALDRPSGISNMPDMQEFDLLGTGIPGKLIPEGDSIIFHPKISARKFGAPIRIKWDENRNDAALLFTDRGKAIFIADMSGDGLPDLVSVAASSIRYWPNLGRGRFGPCVTMAEPPRLDHADQFDPAKVKLSDLDGTGPADLLYLGGGKIGIWQNLHGNRWKAASELVSPIPPDVRPEKIDLADVLGDGLPCLVWEDSHLDKSYFTPLLENGKPGLITSAENGVGGETRLSYRSSTSYYLEDQQAGIDWVSTLHFPVHCLARTEQIDHITGLKFASEFRYRHGYYDRQLREFCGFAFVEQRDVEAIDLTGAADEPQNRLFAQPPIVTRNWFHTGIEVRGRDLADTLKAEYFSHENLIFPEPVFTVEGAETGEEWRDAIRAFRGAQLRSEIYCEDASELAAFPISISMSSSRAIRKQARLNADLPGLGGWAVFHPISAGSVSISLDRRPEDPRISHSLSLAENEYGQPLQNVSASYPRRIVDDDLSASLRAQQAKHVQAFSEAFYTDGLPGSLTIPAFSGPNNAYRLPSVYESCSYELHGLQPRNNFWSVEELVALTANIGPIDYFDNDSQTAGKRLTAHSRNYWIDETYLAALPLGTQNNLALGHHSEILAFAPGMADTLYGEKLDEGRLHQAGYMEEADGSWWIISGTPIHAEHPAEHYYQPIGSRDPFGTVSHLERDEFAMMVERLTDALGHTEIYVNDYRTMGPKLARNANGNWSATETDAFGRVIATAVMGKLASGETAETGRETDAALDTLDNPTSRMSYDVWSYAEGRGPCSARAENFEEHFGINPARHKIQESVEYSGGLGQVVMAKAKTRAGIADDINADGSLQKIDTRLLDPPAPRWIANGRTIFNNKGQPLKAYEPYFSANDRYEDDPILVEQGISALTFYDALGRAIGGLAPDRSWSVSRITPWQSENWDAVDTLAIADPGLDPELGMHFASLDPEFYAPGWADIRLSDARGAGARRAAELALQAAATPARSYTDSLGREILAVADNGERGSITTSSELDNEGNLLAIIDSRNNRVTEMRYGLIPAADEETPKPSLHTISMEAGQSWQLPDVMGRPFCTWDDEGRLTELRYDILGRPIETWLFETDQSPVRVSATLYGDDAPDAAALNLIGAPWKGWDQAGSTIMAAYDHAGNILSAQLRFISASEGLTAWPDNVSSREVLLEAEEFSSSTSYDALGRPITSIAPHSVSARTSETFLSYHEGGALHHVEIEATGTARTVYVEDIDHDAKGQRQFIEYGSGIISTYAYDPENYRLTHMQTMRGTEKLQDLHYEYDPVGNIMSIRDDAQQTVFFSNAVIEPHSEFEYDAVYRLIEATGREHIDQAGIADWASGMDGRAHPQDGQRMRRYTQLFAYDAVGNIEAVQHVAAGGNWSRHYKYRPENNRLISTHRGSIDAIAEHVFSYTARGSFAGMPHIETMQWNYAEQLSGIDKGAGETAHYRYAADGQRVRKVRRFPGGRETERLYLGSTEIWRERVNGILKTERETLHVMDDSSRIALIETLTIENGEQVTAAEPLARYQLGNHLGSVSLELDGSGAIISYEEYHPYGTAAYRAVTAAREVPAKRYGYTGKERDEESGLTYHGARYYAPWLARWTAADPGGMVDGVNWYAYVRGNPVNAHDPDGMGSEYPAELEVAKRCSATDPDGVGWALSDPRANASESRLAFEWAEAETNRQTMEFINSPAYDAWMAEDVMVAEGWIMSRGESYGYIENRENMKIFAANRNIGGSLAYLATGDADSANVAAAGFDVILSAGAPRGTTSRQLSANMGSRSASRTLQRAPAGSTHGGKGKKAPSGGATELPDGTLAMPAATPGRTIAAPTRQQTIGSVGDISGIRSTQHSLDASFLREVHPGWRAKQVYTISFGEKPAGGLNFAISGNNRMPSPHLSRLMELELGLPGGTLARISGGKRAIGPGPTGGHAEPRGGASLMNGGVSGIHQISTHFSCPGCTNYQLSQGITNWTGFQENTIIRFPRGSYGYRKDFVPAPLP